MRVSQDPQKAIDELVARTATASGLSTPLVLSHKDVCGEKTWKERRVLVCRQQEQNENIKKLQHRLRHT